MMRALIWLTVLLAGLYAGYWYVGSRAALRGAETALAAAEARGMTDAAEVGIAGFPSRFDLTVEPFRLRQPPFDWRADFLQVFALSWRPHHLIAVWPDAQRLTVAGRPMDLTVDDMRGSAVVAPGDDLALDRATVVIEAPELAAPGGQGFAARQIRLAVGAEDAARQTLRLGLEALDIVPATGSRAVADPGGALPDSIDWLRIDATLGLDAPLDRQALSVPPRPESLEIRDLSLRWGALSLTAAGRLGIDRDGRLAGQIDLEAARWREVLGLAVAAGLVRAELAPTYGAALTALANAAGGPDDTIRVPLVFAGGWATLGPLPLGRAPRLR